MTRKWPIYKQIPPYRVQNKVYLHLKAWYRARHTVILLLVKKLFILIIIINSASPVGAASALNNTDALKLYAHSRIMSDLQYQCFYKLITKESNWRVNAKNGSHYGIGQMRNVKYKNLDGFRQVDWSKRYIEHRYGSMCNAWRFWLKNGYH